MTELYLFQTSKSKEEILSNMNAGVGVPEKEWGMASPEVSSKIERGNSVILKVRKTINMNPFQRAFFCTVQETEQGCLFGGYFFYPRIPLLLVYLFLCPVISNNIEWISSSAAPIEKLIATLLFSLFYFVIGIMVFGAKHFLTFRNREAKVIDFLRKIEES